MKLIVCICGNEFNQNHGNQKYCYECSNNPGRVNKFKKEQKSIKSKTQTLDKLIKSLRRKDKLRRYYQKNKVWRSEIAKQRYIKNNL